MFLCVFPELRAENASVIANVFRRRGFEIRLGALPDRKMTVSLVVVVRPSGASAALVIFARTQFHISGIFHIRADVRGFFFGVNGVRDAFAKPSGVNGTEIFCNALCFRSAPFQSAEKRVF